MFLYIVLLCALTCVSPFLIKLLVQYIKTGVNPYKDTYEFGAFDADSRFVWATPDVQYGMTLAVVFVLSQMVQFFLQEYAWFNMQILTAHMTNSVIGMVYKKQLRISDASNKHFDNGQIINFVQADSQKMYNVAS